MIRNKGLKAGVMTLVAMVVLAFAFDANAQRGGRGGGGGRGGSGGGQHGGGGGGQRGGGGGGQRGGHTGGQTGGHTGGQVGHGGAGAHQPVGGRVAHSGYAGTNARVGHVGGRPYHFYAGHHAAGWYGHYWFHPYGWGGWGWGWHYGWAYSNFWWGVYPWWNWYGYYWRPYYYYYDPYYFLTDYIVGSMMSQRAQTYTQAYGDQEVQAPQGSTAANAGMTEEQKKQLHDQVQAEMNARQNNQTVDFNDKLKDPNHSFIIAGNFSVIPKGAIQNADGSMPTCKLGEGDVLRVVPHAPVDQPTIDMMVWSSMAGDCPAGKVVNITMSELVTSENAFNTFLDKGAEAVQNDKTLSASLETPPKMDGAPTTPGYQPANPPVEPQPAQASDDDEDEE